MPSHRSRGALAVAGTVLLLALVTAGCGRRGLPASAAGAGAGADEGLTSPAAIATEPSPSEPVETAVPSPTLGVTPPPAPAATQPPGPAPKTTVAPFSAPDLTAIERLLADLDAALGADATADSEEGSTP